MQGLSAGAKRIRTLGPTRVRRPRQPQGSLLTPRWREMDSNPRSPAEFGNLDVSAPPHICEEPVAAISSVAQGPKVRGLSAGGNEIRTLGPAFRSHLLGPPLIMSPSPLPLHRKTESRLTRGDRGSEAAPFTGVECERSANSLRAWPIEWRCAAVSAVRFHPCGSRASRYSN